MTSKIKLRRGTKSQMPALELAEPGFATDTKELYIGDGVGNIKVGGNSTLIDLQDTPTTYSGSAGQNVVVNQTEDGVDFVTTLDTSAYFDAYDNTGGLTLSTTWQDVTFDTIRKNSGVFTFNNQIELVITQAATYNINSRVTTNITSGTSRSDCRIRLVKDTGSGYQEVPGTLAYTYNRTIGYGTDSATINVLDDLNIGDKLKVQVEMDSGNSTIQTLADGSSLSVYIPGGVKGNDGTDGADGAPGAGSSLIIKNDGTNVINTPHTALNFTGDLQAVDGGSGVVDISDTRVFGTWVAWGGDESQTSTTSNIFQLKTRLTVYDIPKAYYRLGWYFEWRIQSTGRDFIAQVQIDDVTTVMRMNEESKDTTSWHTASGFVIVKLDSANHRFDLDFRSENNGTASYIRNARLEFWRVA